MSDLTQLIINQVSNLPETPALPLESSFESPDCLTPDDFNLVFTDLIIDNHDDIIIDEQALTAKVDPTEEDDTETVDEDVALQSETPIPSVGSQTDNPSLAWFEASSFVPPSMNDVKPDNEMVNSLDDNKLRQQTAINLASQSPTANNPAPSIASTQPQSNAPHTIDTPTMTAQDIPQPTAFADLLTLDQKKQQSLASLDNLSIQDTAFEEQTMAAMNSVSSDESLAGVFPGLISDLKTVAQTVPVDTKQLVLDHPVSDPQWGEHLNQQIVWLGSQKINSALIKINPQELGPLEISIKVLENNDSNISITAQSQQVRELIEQSMPRLREMMAEQGIQLSQVSVDADANPQRQAANKFYRDQHSYQHAFANPDLPDQPKQIKTAVGLIDYFA